MKKYEYCKTCGKENLKSNSDYCSASCKILLEIPLKSRKHKSKDLNTFSQRLIQSKEWKALRKQVIDHYGAVCMCCGNTQMINVDHIKPKSKYPDLALAFDNLQILCWGCNKKKSFFYETDYRKIS